MTPGVRPNRCALLSVQFSSLRMRSQSPWRVKNTPGISQIVCYPRVRVLQRRPMYKFANAHEVRPPIKNGFICRPVQSILLLECLPTRGEARTLQRLPQHSGPSAAEEPPATPEPESSKTKKGTSTTPRLRGTTRLHQDAYWRFSRKLRPEPARTALAWARASISCSRAACFT